MVQTADIWSAYIARRMEVDLQELIRSWPMLFCDPTSGFQEMERNVETTG